MRGCCSFALERRVKTETGTLTTEISVGVHIMGSLECLLAPRWVILKQRAAQYLLAYSPGAHSSCQFYTQSRLLSASFLDVISDSPLELQKP